MNDSTVMNTIKAKCEVNSFVNHLIKDYSLPSVVIEGIFNGVISDIRQQELAEIVISLQNHPTKEENNVTS